MDKPIDFVHCVPEDLAETVSWRELFNGLKVQAPEAECQERRLEVISFIFRFRVYQLLRSTELRGKLLKKIKIAMEWLDRASHPARANLVDRRGLQYIAMWHNLLSLLEPRYAELSSPVRDTVIKRGVVRYAVKIFSREKGVFPVLAEPYLLDQMRYRVSSDFSARRIINLMEVWGIIEKRQVGASICYIPGCRFPFKRQKKKSRAGRG